MTFMLDSNQTFLDHKEAGCYKYEIELNVKSSTYCIAESKNNQIFWSLINWELR